MASSGYSVGDLNLSIQTIANDTLKSLDAVIERLTLINEGIGKTKTISRSATKIDKSEKTTSSKSTLGSLLKISKWTALLHIANRVGRTVANIATKGADFGETLNLWQVSMGDEFLPQATEFVNKLNEAYGISKKTLMNSQAIFKNMLGSLGQISDETAYRLSEGVTQMALDYASLYNVAFDEAMTKFQAALAGQVRPIRSVSGYDITENTLYQLYQELGGTKTMRQLSRTEKQLLSIYAVFNQMDRSGATGDLKRTIESFANQSRIMAETWSDIQTYSGLILTRTLQQGKVMQYINAALIFASRILENIANSIDVEDAVNSDTFGDITNSGEEALETVENLKEALLDFDKFRALNNSNQDNALGIDITLINAIDRYNSILSNTNFEASNIADEWIEALGGISNIVDKIKGLFDDISKSNFIGLISDMYVTWSNLVPIIGNNEYGLVYWIKEFFAGIDNNIFGTFRDIWAWLDEYIFTEDFFTGIETLLRLLKDLNEALKGDGFEIDPFKRLYNSLKAIGEFLYDIADALGLIAAQREFLKNNSELFDAIWNAFTNMKHPQAEYSFYANGGLPDKGSVFIAGEAGAEIVYNTSNGQSGVANVQQIAQATYQGTMSALRDWWGGASAKNDIPQLREANATGMYEAVTGVAKSYGNKWDKY